MTEKKENNESVPEEMTEELIVSPEDTHMIDADAEDEKALRLKEVTERLSNWSHITHFFTIQPTLGSDPYVPTIFDLAYLFELVDLASIDSDKITSRSHPNVTGAEVCKWMKATATDRMTWIGVDDYLKIFNSRQQTVYNILAALGVEATLDQVETLCAAECRMLGDDNGKTVNTVLYADSGTVQFFEYTDRTIDTSLVDHTTFDDGTKYLRTLGSLDGDLFDVDVYCVLKALALNNVGSEHTIKKLLCAGLRNKGSVQRDLQDCISAIVRARQLHDDVNEYEKFSTIYIYAYGDDKLEHQYAVLLSTILKGFDVPDPIANIIMELINGRFSSAGRLLKAYILLDDIGAIDSTIILPLDGNIGKVKKLPQFTKVLSKLGVEYSEIHSTDPTDFIASRVSKGITPAKLIYGVAMTDSGASIDVDEFMKAIEPPMSMVMMDK